MRDVILLLYLHDEKYGKRLLRYLAGKKNPVLYPELVTCLLYTSPSPRD